MKKLARMFLGWIRRGGVPLFVRNLTGGYKNQPKQALLYYKTGAFLKSSRLDYAHTNEWEILEIVRILNRLGFCVDIIDRAAEDFMPDNVYDLFLGLAAGASGKYFARYAKAMPKAIKIAICAGPEPGLSRKLVQDQYDRFNARHNSNVPAMRMPNVDFDAFIEQADGVFAIGEEGTFCPESYKKHGKPVLPYLPGCSPDIRFLPDWIKSRDRKKFLCFAGHGLICKGVDLIVEAFAEEPDLSVHICGPDNEKAFFEILGPVIQKHSNITYEGFIQVGGSRFEQLVSSCSFVVFNSSSEGCATSVATAARMGLVPVVNKETGLGIGDFGIEITNKNSDRIKATRLAIRKAAQMENTEYSKCVFKTLADAQKYTQSAFTDSFTRALIKTFEQEYFEQEV